MFKFIKPISSAFVIAALLAVACLPSSISSVAAQPAPPLQVVVLGDSLSAGYQLPQESAFPTLLERALRADGLNVDVANAGVSGDTARNGLERLDWAVPDGTHAVIVELGANDMLRGADPEVTKDSLDKIISRLKLRGVKVMLAGMVASPSLGREYGDRFNAIYPDLARKHDVPLYPFFLEGVAGNRTLNLEDGMHPNRRGVEMIVRSIFPTVREFLNGVAG
ncbi:MAG: arylesterase [Beijerinckiaceae bacterium]|nr:arylesterase [Beijerinckiaceae bacterium]